MVLTRLSKGARTRDGDGARPPTADTLLGEAALRLSDEPNIDRRIITASLYARANRQLLAAERGRPSLRWGWTLRRAPDPLAGVPRCM
jgi:hypothetical protein